MKTNRMLDPRNAALVEKHGRVLRNKEYEVLDWRTRGWTFLTISHALSCTRQRIQQIERRALAKLERAEVME